MNNQYLKIAVCVPQVKLGNPEFNKNEILKICQNHSEAKILLFPEMSITGYSVGDWILNEELLINSNKALKDLILQSTEQIIIVGGPLSYDSNLYNVAYIIQNKHILGIVPKYHLPSYREFFENRLFLKGNALSKIKSINLFDEEVPVGKLIFKDSSSKISFGLEICEDLWQNKAPHIDLYEKGAQIVFNLSSSTFQVDKALRRESLCKNASYLGHGAYIYTSTGISETSSDIVMSGHMIACELGEILVNNEVINESSVVELVDIDLEAIYYQRHLLNIERSNIPDIRIVGCLLRCKEYLNYHLNRKINLYPFALNETKKCEDVINIITAALHHRLKHIGINKVILGISGGLDSTLALLMINECYKRYKLDKNGIIACSMPGLGTGETSQNNTKTLMNLLNLKLYTYDIKNETLHHFDLIGQDNQNRNVTFENIQARYRTLILMNLANKEDGIVCGTSDMSEIALGWSTFNGDQMSMYNLNGGLPKTAIRDLTAYFGKKYPELNNCLTSIVKMPITPELTGSDQLTEDIIGSYVINDFIMYHLFEKGASKNRITYLLKQAFTLNEEEALTYYHNFIKRFCRNQFKRLTGPESVKIFNFSFSARSDLHFPGDMKD